MFDACLILYFSQHYYYLLFLTVSHIYNCLINDYYEHGEQKKKEFNLTNFNLFYKLFCLLRIPPRIYLTPPGEVILKTK